MLSSRSFLLLLYYSVWSISTDFKSTELEVFTILGVLIIHDETWSPIGEFKIIAPIFELKKLQKCNFFY